MWLNLVKKGADGCRLSQMIKSKRVPQSHAGPWRGEARRCGAWELSLELLTWLWPRAIRGRCSGTSGCCWAEVKRPLVLRLWTGFGGSPLRTGALETRSSPFPWYPFHVTFIWDHFPALLLFCLWTHLFLSYICNTIYMYIFIYTYYLNTICFSHIAFGLFWILFLISSFIHFLLTYINM